MNVFLKHDKHSEKWLVYAGIMDADDRRVVLRTTKNKRMALLKAGEFMENNPEVRWDDKDNSLINNRTKELIN